MTPCVLTIAGSDSSGGAGIQADLKTFAALECYGSAVLTALTAQNTLGVKGVHACPPEFVAQQLDAVLEDIPVKALKLGMLANASIAESIAPSLESFKSTCRPIVIDPVMVSSSGHRLLETSAISVLQSRLIPLATLITPNIPEAELLLGGHEVHINSIPSMQAAARDLSKRFGCPNVLVKGGHRVLSFDELHHVPEEEVKSIVEYEGICDPEYPAVLAASLPDNSSLDLIVDVLFTASTESFTCFARPQVNTRSTHGTGCTLSAAIACELAKERPVIEAVRAGITFTYGAIATAEPIGSGHGPLNHQHALMTRGVPRPIPTSPHPFLRSMIASSGSTWGAYVKHDFVVKLGSGVLPEASFKHFITQDYLYLKYYARAHGLLALKSSSFADISASAVIMQHVAREAALHESYCASWGIDAATLATTEEATATTAYGAFILDMGIKGDALALLVALCACLLGYGEVGLWLKQQSDRNESPIHLAGNPYRKWMEDYGGVEYQEACRTGIKLLEGRIEAHPLTGERVQELQQIWQRCVKLECGFWDMAMSLAQ
ncbi:hypothetical protein DL93DRAFT_2137347 [Clavulina sp. PMI_390]|nr:hypothetical protein DL93DRAFT_2137347 [Clavulina sp. PMI_390]